MKALAIRSMIRVQALMVVEGETVAEVDCADYDAFKNLPDAIKVEGKLLGKTGWSSDRHYACYKERVMLGQIVDVKG